MTEQQSQQLAQQQAAKHAAMQQAMQAQAAAQQQANGGLPSPETLEAMRESEEKRLNMIIKAQNMEEQRIKNINNTLVNNQLNLDNIIKSYLATDDILKSATCILDEISEKKVRALQIMLVEGLCNFWMPPKPQPAQSPVTAPAIVPDQVINADGSVVDTGKVNQVNAEPTIGPDGAISEVSLVKQYIGSEGEANA